MNKMWSDRIIYYTLQTLYQLSEYNWDVCMCAANADATYCYDVQGTFQIGLSNWFVPIYTVVLATHISVIFWELVQHL